MNLCPLFALAGLAIAAPASAATILLHPDGAEHRAAINIDMFLGEGVYAARFAFDRPVGPECLLTFIHNVDYDFYGVADGIHYGGDDVPTFWDHSFTGSTFSTLLRVERPYRQLWHWAGEIGDVEERGVYSVNAAFGEFTFDSPAPVRLDYGFERVGEVPEPSSWAMLIAGFLALGTALRRQRVRVGLGWL
ncbi:PEPxxWA-CTERM sorting domain-containing protein [Rhizorhapis suberifaciens]|uniref:Ice-binding protein C-terminal domain-containing protein n=1 Tax=Rhizorhapis suberifaciens TaxID=13656 RepID=A0A840HVL3_9SPHN|nr:PEPxxWA-CTERM sorting domain-containing protein [Rhizorhapis suberifaciens]MBB4642095.1 hypothetical protein [Rhizorhapis suberifaciens]